MMDAPFTELFRRMVAADGLSLRELSSEVVKCERCRLDIPVSALRMENRCVDPACPVNAKGAA
jgi:hypothetical protein